MILDVHGPVIVSAMVSFLFDLYDTLLSIAVLLHSTHQLVIAYPRALVDLWLLSHAFWYTKQQHFFERTPLLCPLAIYNAVLCVLWTPAFRPLCC